MNGVNDMIYRRAAIDVINKNRDSVFHDSVHYEDAVYGISNLPSAQPKETPKRVLWSGWQGYRDTRYRCPLCKTLVRNGDAYCHRCGQHLMFPNISFTPYIPGQKQDIIVRWKDESE